MKVQRTELLEFTVILSDNEFKIIACVGEHLKLGMEQTVAEIVAMGLTDFTNVLKDKENKNVVDG